MILGYTRVASIFAIAMEMGDMPSRRLWANNSASGRNSKPPTQALSPTYTYPGSSIAQTSHPLCPGSTVNTDQSIAGVAA